MKPCHAPFVALAVLVALLSGCEKTPGEAESKTLVTVAGENISEAELNLAVSRLGARGEAKAAEASPSLLQALIDQRLIEQAARKAALDKESEVAITMAQASRQVLVEAYAERNFKDVAKPTEAGIADYYAQHPELFSQRRIYRIQELDLKLDPSRVPELEAKLKASHSLGDFANWLKEQGIEGQATTAVKPAEQIAAPLLERFSQMKDGQVTISPGRQGHVLILQLQESQLQAVTLDQAKDAIERALTFQKRNELMEAELKKLREAAKIEYATGYSPKAGTKTDSEKVAK